MKHGVVGLVVAAAYYGLLEATTVSGRMNPRRLAGRIGQGGRTLDVETVNGSIRLRTAP